MRGLATAGFLAASLLGAVPSQAQRIGDPERGAELFRDCVRCHQVGNAAGNGIGPHLNGVFGRAAAGIDGFRYSDSLMREGVDGLIWTARTLDAYIDNPKRFASGTRMNYAGMKDSGDRADLLAYLRQFSDDPSDLPEAAPTIVVARPELELGPEILGLEGDVGYGEYLSGECLACHRLDGTTEGIPAITGWPREDFVVAMHAYKQKLRPHPVMQMMAGRLGNDEIAALAAFFGQSGE